MAGLRGNQAYLAVAKQAGTDAATRATNRTVAATPAAATTSGGAVTATTFKNAFSGGSIGPVRETDRLAETDSSRDQGASFVTSAGVEGSPEIYARPDSLGLYLGAVLGGIAAPSGTTPNFTHVFTPADDIPYYTFWKMLGGTLYEQYIGCRVGSLTIAAEAGAPLTVSAGVMGITPSRLDATTHAATITALTGVAMDQEAVFSFNDATVSLGDNQATPVLAPTQRIRSFELTIENNLSSQQTDDLTPYDTAVGMREISLGFDMIFENMDEYNKFHYGAIAATAISPNIYTTTARFQFTKDANTSVDFLLPSIVYEEFPVEPDPGGDPIVVSCRAVAQRATGVTNLVTATLKNNVTTYV